MPSPQAIAERWVEYFSEELSGRPASFAVLPRSIEAKRRAVDMPVLTPPTFDEVLDALRVCSRGKAMGPDVIPIELILVGGLLAAFLLYRLIVDCWFQCEAPLYWKGGRLFNIPKSGGSCWDCEG